MSATDSTMQLILQHKHVHLKGLSWFKIFTTQLLSPKFTISILLRYQFKFFKMFSSDFSYFYHVLFLLVNELHSNTNLRKWADSLNYNFTDVYKKKNIGNTLLKHFSGLHDELIYNTV